MSKLQFSVYEFMAIMGRIDEDLNGAKPDPDSVFLVEMQSCSAILRQVEQLATMDIGLSGKLAFPGIDKKARPRFDHTLDPIRNEHQLTLLRASLCQ